MKPYLAWDCRTPRHGIIRLVAGIWPIFLTGILPARMPLGLASLAYRRISA